MHGATTKTPKFRLILTYNNLERVPWVVVAAALLALLALLACCTRLESQCECLVPTAWLGDARKGAGMQVSQTVFWVLSMSFIWQEETAVECIHCVRCGLLCCRCVHTYACTHVYAREQTNK